MDRIINLGIIGCGYWGSLLVKKFNLLPNAKVSFVADINKSCLLKIKKQFPKTQTTTNYKKILNNKTVNAVVIATPVSSHYRLAKEALKKDKHVFVEKPLSQTTSQAKEIIQLAKKKKLVLTTDCTYLYHPAVQKIKKLIDQKKLGKIIFIQSLRLGLELFPKGVDVLWDLAPHDISIIYYLIGKEPKKISIQKSNSINKTTTDTAFIHLQYPHNLKALVFVSWLSPTKVRYFAVGGDKGSLVFDETQKKPLLFFETRVENFGKHKIFQPETIGRKIGFSEKEPLMIACQDFIDSIRKKREPLSSKNISLKTVQIMEKLK